MKPIQREIRDYVVRRYLAGTPSTVLERETGVHNTAILKFVKMAGYQTRPRGVQAYRCIEIDCDKPTNGRKRCDLHRRIRDAETNLDLKWKYYGQICKCGRECMGQECRSCSAKRIMKKRRRLGR